MKTRPRSHARDPSFGSFDVPHLDPEDSESSLAAHRRYSCRTCPTALPPGVVQRLVLVGGLLVATRTLHQVCAERFRNMNSDDVYAQHFIADASVVVVGLPSCVLLSWLVLHRRYECGVHDWGMVWLTGCTVHTG